MICIVQLYNSQFFEVWVEEQRSVGGYEEGAGDSGQCHNIYTSPPSHPKVFPVLEKMRKKKSARWLGR